MRSRIHVVGLPSELGEFAEDVRRVYLELGRFFGAESLAGECHPPVDVFETDDTVEIAADLPGVARHALRVLGKGDSVLIVGEKGHHRAAADSHPSLQSFHLVERGYGRFARVIRLGRTCDVSRARASLVGGELHVSIPKIHERRGGLFTIAVDHERH